MPLPPDGASLIQATSTDGRPPQLLTRTFIQCADIYVFHDEIITRVLLFYAGLIGLHRFGRTEINSVARVAWISEAPSRKPDSPARSVTDQNICDASHRMPLSPDGASLIQATSTDGRPPQLLTRTFVQCADIYVFHDKIITQVLLFYAGLIGLHGFGRTEIYSVALRH